MRFGWVVAENTKLTLYHSLLPHLLTTMSIQSTHHFSLSLDLLLYLVKQLLLSRVKKHGQVIIVLRKQRVIRVGVKEGVKV